MMDENIRFPDQIIGHDAHLKLVFEGWTVLRADHVKKMQRDLLHLRAKILQESVEKEMGK